MCAINSFVGYAIVKSKTSGIFIFLYRFTILLNVSANCVAYQWKSLSISC